LEMTFDFAIASALTLTFFELLLFLGEAGLKEALGPFYEIFALTFFISCIMMMVGAFVFVGCLAIGYLLSKRRLVYQNQTHATTPIIFTNKRRTTNE